MRTTHATLVLALTAALTVGATAQDAGAPRGGTLPWEHDLGAATERARADGRPLLLYFTHDH